MISRSLHSALRGRRPSEAKREFVMAEPRAMTTLEIKVKPGSKRPGVIREGERLLVAVAERAVEGAANEATIAALAKALGIAPSRLAILRGHRGRLKIVGVTGLSREEMRDRLANIALP